MDASDMRSAIVSTLSKKFENAAGKEVFGSEALAARIYKMAIDGNQHAIDMIVDASQNDKRIGGPEDWC